MIRDLSPWTETVAVVAATVAEDYPNANEEALRAVLLWRIRYSPAQFTSPTDPGVTEALVLLADQICRWWRAADLHDSPQYDYRPSDVRLVLETLYADQRYWLSGWVPEDAVSIKPSADSLDICCDVSTAIEGLHRNDQRLLLLYYCDGFELDPDVEPKFHGAVNRLTEQLNSYRGKRCT